MGFVLDGKRADGRGLFVFIYPFPLSLICLLDYDWSCFCLSSLTRRVIRTRPTNHRLSYESQVALA